MHKNLKFTHYPACYCYLVISLILFISINVTHASSSVMAEQQKVLISSQSTIDFSPQEKSWIANNKDVLFTGDPNWLPYEAFDKEGNYIGIVAEHLKLIEQKTGLHFKPQVVDSWTESLHIATTGKVSVISGDAADDILNKQFKI